LCRVQVGSDRVFWSWNVEGCEVYEEKAGGLGTDNN
jgi:hypothetical protein